MEPYILASLPFPLCDMTKPSYPDRPNQGKLARRPKNCTIDKYEALQLCFLAQRHMHLCIESLEYT